MTPAVVHQLDQWASMPRFRRLTVRQAAAQLAEILPGYPSPFDQPVEICVNGYRWYRHEMEAVADALQRALRRPKGPSETLEGPDWDVDRNEQGLWCVPGICTRRAVAAPPGRHAGLLLPMVLGACLAADMAMAAGSARFGDKLVNTGDGAGKVMQVAGKPDRVIQEENAFSANVGERWEYYQSGKTIQIEFRDGKVSNVREVFN